MNKFIFFLFLSLSIFSQKPKGTILEPIRDTLSPTKSKTTKTINSQKVIEPDLFSSEDLITMDSLLIDEKFNSALVDSLEYVIDDKDIVTSAAPTLTTDLLKQRLLLLNEKTPFNLAYNPGLEKVINSYLSSRRKYFPQLLARAKYYFPIFEQYLDEYDIPLEMKYLAIIESALHPEIKSRSGAAGLWQFMYGTGKQFDLNVTSYVDERQDPVKSTIAACKYLSQLYKIFGDWDLALAAYNSGPGNVSKAIQRSGGNKNYWNIRPYLPKETASYVPAFYATMYIFEYAEEHNIHSELPQFYSFETDTIRVKKTIGFDHIREILNIEENVISFLNPVYKLDIIPFIKDQNYSVRLPKAKIIEFLEKEEEIYALAAADEASRDKPMLKYSEMGKSTRYRVKNGDFLGKIADKFGVRVSDIKRWNTLKTSNLKIGQRLTIFSKQGSSSQAETSSKKGSSATEKGSYDIYTVKKGDSLWTISKKFKNVSINEIKKWNNIWSAKSLKPGTKLKIYKS
jgi:membrane-bound lytic murein transglycosylase D